MNESSTLYEWNSRAGLIKADTYLELQIKTALEFVTKSFAVYLPLGILGNVVSFLVTTTKENRRISTCVYMSALAAMDSMVLLALASYMFLWTFGLGFSLDESTIAKVHLFIWYSANTFGMSSGIFLALMSIDRAIVVQFPLKARTICTPSSAKKALSFFFVPALININFFFTFKVHKDKLTGAITEILYHPDPPWVETVVGLYILIVGTAIPFIIIISCNILIIINVQGANRRRNKMAAESKMAAPRGDGGSHLTRILIVVSLAYLILSVPLRVSDLVFKLPIVQDDYDMDVDYWNLRYNLIRNCLFIPWTMNYAANFYLYLLCGGKNFRNDTLNVLFCCFRKKTK
ncbi:somatostatin receptor type 4-like [Lineus longissimus]|uniref:somatostatin receptor type 4-like n=1 Tax=Lineus longissimus TaxID=88925 RepID=UPI00315C76BB